MAGGYNYFFFDVDGTLFNTPKILKSVQTAYKLKDDPFYNLHCFKDYNEYVDFYTTYPETYVNKDNIDKFSKVSSLKKLKKSPLNNIYVCSGFKEDDRKALENFLVKYGLLGYESYLPYKTLGMSNESSIFFKVRMLKTLIELKRNIKRFYIFDDDPDFIQLAHSQLKPCGISLDFVAIRYPYNEKKVNELFVNNKCINVLDFDIWFEDYIHEL
jgi:heat shock protein HspQ